MSLPAGVPESSAASEKASSPRSPTTASSVPAGLITNVLVSTPSVVVSRSERWPFDMSNSLRYTGAAAASAPASAGSGSQWLSTKTDVPPAPPAPGHAPDRSTPAWREVLPVAVGVTSKKSPVNVVSLTLSK